MCFIINKIQNDTQKTFYLKQFHHFIRKNCLKFQDFLVNFVQNSSIFFL